jgi:hypothetical protein
VGVRERLQVRERRHIDDREAEPRAPPCDDVLGPNRPPVRQDDVLAANERAANRPARNAQRVRFARVELAWHRRELPV